MELWTVALIWLLWRLWTVLSSPIDVLKTALGQVPVLLPEITVDQLSCDWAAIRWRYPAHTRHAAKHSLEVVNLKTGAKRLLDSDRGQSRIIIEDLMPDTDYSVTLYAQPGRRLAAKIDLHTTTGPRENAPITEWTQPASSKSPVRGTYEPQKSISQVKKEIEQLQADFNREYGLRHEAIADFKAAETKLKVQLEAASMTRKGEQSARSHQRSEIKTLEDTKHSLELKRKNDQSKHRQLQQMLNMHHSTQNRWATELGERKSALKTKRKQISIERQAWQDQCDVLRTRLSTATAELNRSDPLVRQAVVSLKSAEQSKKRVRELINALEKHTDITTGLLSPSFAPTSTEHTPEEEGLISEYTKDTSIEDEWVTLQQGMENRYVAAYQRHEQANRALEHAQARAHEQSRAQAQLYANAFSSSGLSLQPSPKLQSSAPVVSELLPSYLFKDDTLQVPSTSNVSLGGGSFGYQPWKATSNRSRDSSIFFSAAGSIDDSYSSIGASAIGEDAEDESNEPFNNVMSTPKAEPLSSPSSPDKFRWRLVKKPVGSVTSASSNTSTTSNFVRRLSFFRKDNKEEDPSLKPSEASA